jgi:hypothetical protein
MILSDRVNNSDDETEKERGSLGTVCVYHWCINGIVHICSIIMIIYVYCYCTMLCSVTPIVLSFGH